jgi:peroxiredoxin
VEASQGRRSTSRSRWPRRGPASTRCPCTARYLSRLNSIVQQFEKRSVRLVGINSNANELPEDAVAFARNQHLRFPLLKDNDGSVARALRPQATPTVFILDSQRRVRYHGAIDDSVDGDNIHRFYLREGYTRTKTSAVFSKSLG